MHRTIRKSLLAGASALVIFGGAHAQDAKTLATYVGHYELAPGVVMAVTYEAGHLYAQLTDQDRFEVFPDGAGGVAWKVVDAKATFEMGPDGRISGLVLHQNAQDVPARKVD